MLINIHNHENNTTTVYNRDATVTIKELKELYCETVKDTDVNKDIDIEDVKAWAGSPMLDDNKNLIDYNYNLAYNNIDIYMATYWPEEISSVLKYYL
jgi:hypothetical protein